MAESRTLQLGSKGPDVEWWQRTIGVVADGIFGPGTDQMTRMWQQAHGLKPDGVVGPITRETAATANTVPPPPVEQPSATPSAFIEAKNFTRGRYGSPVNLIVVHTMESQEKPGTARAVAQWFAGSTAPQASAHFCVDDAEIVQCVRESDMAWGAPGANRNGVHIEHAGRAAQSPEEWADPYSESMLRRSAALCADICRRNSIPIKRLSADEVKSGAKGICGHADVTKAFPALKGTHTDPGVSFPWTRYIELIIAADGLTHLVANG